MIRLSQEQRQKLALAPRQLQGLNLLMKSIPELRAEIVREMSRNPAIEDFDQTLETPLSSVERKEDQTATPDYPEEDFEPGHNYDEEAVERRQAFFDNQVKEETLQEHLMGQMPFSDIPPSQYGLAEILVGDLDANGYYKGSIPDTIMGTGCSEKVILSTLAAIRELDPAGCGARTPQECLLAQMDKLDGNPRAPLVRKLVESHLDDLAAGRIQAIAAALGVSEAECEAAAKTLRNALDAFPGRPFPSASERVEYVNPEIHTVFADGRWQAETDSRSLPEIHLSKNFLKLAQDPNQTPEVKDYVNERIAAARAFREAVAKRQETVQNIATAIYERQQDFFTQGFKALRPMTEGEIAKAVGVHPATVSRTVRNKYAATPKGTIELRRFFSAVVQNAEGENVSQQAVLAEVKKIVDGEDKHAPLSDEKIAAALKSRGYAMARRTIAKYRGKLKIPGVAERRI